jgi:wobble nucleotide-excising tRNase
MLKSIERIRKLGVYQTYTKPAGIKEFSSKNLIYGWNYSGKTTLSRLFAKLEAKSPHPDFKDCEFTFNGGPDAITEKNFHQLTQSVRVFNPDFVRDNLSFDSGSCNAILLLGKESEEAQRKINKLNDRVKAAMECSRGLSKTFDEHNEAIREAKRVFAQNIRLRIKIDPYNAAHLDNDILAIGLLDESQLLSEKNLADAIDLALTPDSKKPLEVSPVHSAPSIKKLHEDAKGLLSATPTFSNTLRHLEENPAVERWIESGLGLHVEPGTCEFCGNTITQNRLDAFRSHFSKDLAEHKNKVLGLQRRVDAAAIKIELPKPAELNPQFRDTYIEASRPLEEKVKAFDAALSTLAEEVKSKAEFPRKCIYPSPISDDIESGITDTLAAINNVIKANNALAANFVQARKDALRKAKNHFVQEASDRLRAEGRERKKRILTARADRLKSFVQRLQSYSEKLQAEISRAQQGREQINERLASMLGSEAIQIKVIKDATDQERFQLVRKNGGVAKNLSDGERTAIAFSYFLTKLKELKEEEFKETIVYIDDPISSLDSNHIFQVTAAINDLFFEKVKQQNGSEAWKTACKQLFVSTHNFEFFNLLRELKPDGNNEARLYIVKRIGEGQSELRDMPASLARYGSEYQFLFDQVYRFHTSADKVEHEHLLILPNALRRFVELYTFSRIPSTQRETVDQRAAVLFGKERAKAILKFLHTFSHGNTIERILGNNELIFLL